MTYTRSLAYFIYIVLECFFRPYFFIFFIVIGCILFSFVSLTTSFNFIYIVYIHIFVCRQILVWSTQTLESAKGRKHTHTHTTYFLKTHDKTMCRVRFDMMLVVMFLLFLCLFFAAADVLALLFYIIVIIFGIYVLLNVVVIVAFWTKARNHLYLTVIQFFL